MWPLVLLLRFQIKWDGSWVWETKNRSVPEAEFHWLLEQYFKHNKKTASSENLITYDHCEIYFLFYQSKTLSSVCAFVAFVGGGHRWVNQKDFRRKNVTPWLGNYLFFPALLWFLTSYLYPDPFSTPSSELSRVELETWRTMRNWDFSSHRDENNLSKMSYIRHNKY